MADDVPVCEGCNRRKRPIYVKAEEVDRGHRGPRPVSHYVCANPKCPVGGEDPLSGTR